MNKTKNRLAERLTEARKNKKWTQMDLAKVLKVNVKNISRWELAIARPTIDAAVDLCKALGISMNELNGVSDTSSKHKDPLIRLLQAKLPQLSQQQKTALKAIIEVF